MSFWEVFALLVTSPLWAPFALVGAMFVAVAFGALIAIPCILIAEAFRK